VISRAECRAISTRRPKRTYRNREATATAAPLFTGTVCHHQRRPPTSSTRIFFIGLSERKFHFKQGSPPSIFPKKRLVFMLWVKVLLFIKRLFTFLATPWSTNGSWAIRGQLLRALGPALPSTRIQSPLYSYCHSR
jgi:hypothetical protein